MIYRFFKKQFEFSRAETSTVLVICGMIIVAIILPYILSPYWSNDEQNEIDKKELAKWTAQIDSIGQSKKLAKDTRSENATLFLFDPNNTSVDSLLLLGFPMEIANRLRNYIDKGGRVEIPSDLYKIYNIDSALVVKLWPFIDITPTSKNIKNEITSAKKHKLKDLNLASASELEEVKGIGIVLSNRIIKYKKLLGGYYDFAQLREVYGLSDEVIRRLETNFHLNHDDAITKININTAGFKELIRHPYINKMVTRKIINHREKGLFTSDQDLKRVKLVSDSTFVKLRPYIEF